MHHTFAKFVNGLQRNHTLMTDDQSTRPLIITRDKVKCWLDAVYICLYLQLTTLNTVLNEVENVFWAKHCVIFSIFLDLTVYIYINTELRNLPGLAWL